MDFLPPAIVIASQNAVRENNNVMFRLVQPLPDNSGVQSAGRLVNVVPFRRTYCFEKKEEIDTFRREILRRPLVLQPVLHFGRGLGNYCGACYNDEHWVVMINQTHPKVLSRLQMGLDQAKAAIARGQSVEVKFCFGKLIQRVYRQHLNQKEMGEAQSRLDELMLGFRFSEWEYCDLTVRYHGFTERLNRNPLYSFKHIESTWEFEDIGMHEMLWSQVDGQVFTEPHLAPVTEDEIRHILPAWTINAVSPLEEIGDAIPDQNYSYAQAGRLYESFRRKKRQRNQQRAGPTAPPAGEIQGAVGYDPSHAEPEHDAIEHNFQQYGDDPKMTYSRSRQMYHNDDDYHDTMRSDAYENYMPSYRHGDSGNEDVGSDVKHNLRHELHTAQTPYQNAIPVPAMDRYGHVDASVKINSQVSGGQRGLSSAQQYNKPETQHYHLPNPSSQDYHDYGAPLKKQDSDRSSRSTNADSGYCPGDRPSRGGSYDNTEHDYTTKSKTGYGHDNIPLNNVADSHNGLENPAFRQDDSDSALQKHKELVARMMQEQGRKEQQLNRSTDSAYDYTSHSNTVPHPISSKHPSNDVMKAPPRRKKMVAETGSPTQIAESFI